MQAHDFLNALNFPNKELQQDINAADKQGQEHDGNLLSFLFPDCFISGFSEYI